MPAPLNVKSHYSLLHSPTKIDKLVEKCVELKYPACALTDLNSVSGAVEFSKACKKANIKSILGVELSITGSNQQLPLNEIINRVILAKNINGWKGLVKLVSKRNIEGKVDEQDIYQYSNDIIVLESEKPSYYLNKEDVEDHRLLLCSYLKTTTKKIKETPLPKELHNFFTTDDYALSASDKSDEIADQCENYSILSKPNLPKFECPDGLNENDYLRKLCQNRLPDDQKYVDRMNLELKVFEEANLAGYFLIVQDYVNWAKNKGWLVGPSRGSVGGSLVAFLIGITTTDPLKYNLLFERFYNSGRNTKDRVSLPDIDVDFPKFHRDEVFEYITNKYGYEYARSIGTFGGLQGKAALKEVLRVHDVCDQKTADIMTRSIPEESKISDKLEESQESSILKWVLKYEPRIVKDYCTMNDKGELVGDYAKYFEQAIRIEGTYKSIGKHASAMVVSKDKLDEICPVLSDRTAMEMHAVEDLGLVKLDILSVASLDRLMLVNQLLRNGKIC